MLLWDFAIWSLTMFVYLFVAYILTMALYDRYKGTKWEWAVKVFVAGPFLIFDAFVNIVVVSIWFLELPEEWLVTSRLKRWRRQYEHKNYNTEMNSRQRRRIIFAVWICDKHLDHYDKITGDHC